jgi:hypothetical protein
VKSLLRWVIRMVVVRTKVPADRTGGPAAPGDPLVPEKPKAYRTKTGKVLTDADIEAMADEAERGYDVEQLKARRHGRPKFGPAPADVVPNRLDPS